MKEHLIILWSGMWRVLLVLFGVVFVVNLTIWSPIIMIIIAFLGASYAVGYNAYMEGDFPLRSPFRKDDTK